MNPMQMDRSQIFQSFRYDLSKCMNNPLALGFFQIPEGQQQTAYNCGFWVQKYMETLFLSKMRRSKGIHARISHSQLVLPCNRQWSLLKAPSQQHEAFDDHHPSSKKHRIHTHNQTIY